jgi:hypothetical protein
MSKALKAIGKAVWKALPWVGLAIWVCLLLISPVLNMAARGELKVEIAALEAENGMYRQENELLRDELDWFRAQIDARETGK